MVNNHNNLNKKDIREHMTNDEDAGKPVTADEWKDITTLLIVCFVLVIASFCMAFFTRKDKSTGITDYLGFTGENANMNSILVGLVSSTIFGLIDNGGLYFGMSSLDPIFRANKMDELEAAGWGNTFSDFLGAFLGTFIGIFVKNMTGIEDTPLWSETIGIVIGCVIGIYLPKYLMGYKVKVDVEEKK